jgi:hypothetical protein
MEVVVTTVTSATSITPVTSALQLRYNYRYIFLTKCFNLLWRAKNSPGDVTLPLIKPLLESNSLESKTCKQRQKKHLKEFMAVGSPMDQTISDEFPGSCITKIKVDGRHHGSN